MAATCTWKSCEETDKDAYIVKFSNGLVKNAKHLDLKLFKHEDDVNPRKKNRRIVVAESNRLPYVGSNFGSGSLQCNNLCRYFVGVLDKSTMQMKVHNAQMFNMLPVIPGESVVDDNTKQAETYREKVDALIEAFGTTKQKRALTSRRLNEVGNEALQKAVAQAASNIIVRKGVKALRKEVVAAEAQTETPLFLQCNTEAEKPEDVYPFDQLLSPSEFDALKDVGLKMATLTPRDLQKMREEGCPQVVLGLLESLPIEDTARDRLSRCAWYLSFLIKVSLQKRTISLKFGTENECPRVILNKVLKNFTVESFNDGRLRNMVSTSMRMKLVSHCLALLLHMGDQKANLTLLHRDMEIRDAKMMELAKAMGLTLSRQTLSCGKEEGIKDEYRIATLVLPLVRYERRTEFRKRKKMN